MQNNMQGSLHGASVPPGKPAKHQAAKQVPADFHGYERDIKDYSNLDEFSLFVGDAFNRRYRSRFEKILGSSGSVALDWNWAGFLLAFPWMIYRKMFLYAFAYFSVVFFFAFWSEFGMVVLPVTHVIMGLFGSSMYYHFADTKISTITGTGTERQNQIEAKGGVLAIPLVIGVCIVMSALSSLLVYTIFMAPKVEQVSSEMRSDLAGIHESVDKKSALRIVMVKQAINSAISAKWATEGKSRLPASAEDLQKEFSLKPELFVDNWETQIEYWPTRTGFKLRSAGPDKEFATDDDLFMESVLDQ